jgi:hypothetical protein
LTITYLADAKSVLAAQGQINAGNTAMAGTTAKTGGTFKQTFGSVIPLAAVAGAAAIVKFGADSVKAFIEAEQVMANTQAVLKSTGGEANITATQIVALSQRLRDLSGVDDEAIQASSNLLLTFRAVHNELGKGNDIFNQAQGAILDMATALNEGAVPSTEQLHSATLSLGKALNDPITGMTALRRVGVSFTQAQRDTIAALVESGDLMGAQKVILAELTKEFGGAAEAAGDTFGGQLAILSSKFGDVQEQVGEALIPALESLADTALTLVPIFELAAKAISSLPLLQMSEDIQQVRNSADGGGAGIGDFADVVLDTIPILGNMVDISDHATDTWETQNGVVSDLSSLFRGEFADAMDTAAEKEKIAENATRALTDAQREQRLATLALTDSYLGIVDSANDVTEAQKELNRLERAGREDTKAYEAAVLDALEAQIGLEDAVLSYGKELAESGETARSVRQKVKDLAADFGIQKGVVNDLLQEIQSYIRELNRVPEKVDTHVTTFYDKVGTPGRALQHGGIVRRPTVALIGEAGPEAVVPLGKGGGMGTTVIVNVAGFVVTERDLVEAVREGLVKTGYRNPDIFGGRA